MLERPLMGRQGGVYWYVLQTSDAAEVAFNRYFNNYFRRCPQLFKKKPNETERVATLINDATVFFKSGEVLENLRAETLDGAIIDEYRQQYPELWPMIIRPMLARRKGWCDFFSTPNGFDHFKDLYDLAEINMSGEWATFHAPSTEAPWWTDAEVQSARETMSEAEFAQEILAEFRDLHQGKAYLNSGLHNHRATNPFSFDGKLCEHLPIVVGLDFNVGLLAWELGQTKLDDWYWHDEIALQNTNTQEATRVLIDRVKGHKPGVILCGDATGNARKTSAAGSTDYSIITDMLSAARIRYENRTPTINPPVKDRVNIVNAKLRAADGTAHLWYNPTACPRLKKDMDRVSWKKNANGVILDQTGDPTLTHASDAMGYPICELSSPFRTEVGTLRVIRR